MQVTYYADHCCAMLMESMKHFTATFQKFKVVYTKKDHEWKFSFENSGSGNTSNTSNYTSNSSSSGSGSTTNTPSPSTTATATTAAIASSINLPLDFLTLEDGKMEAYVEHAKACLTVSFPPLSPPPPLPQITHLPLTFPLLLLTKSRNAWNSKPQQK